MIITPSPLEQHRRRSRVQFSPGAESAGNARRTKRTLSREDEKLLAQLLSVEQDFIDSPIFRDEDAEEKIYDQAPEIQKPDTSWYHPVMDDLSPGKSRTVKSAQQVILTGAEERVLFHQFNYARYRVWKLQQEIWSSPDRKPTPEQAEQMLSWYRRAEVIREQIAETNLALVLAMAKRTRMSEVDFADLVSEGNMALLRAVDKFDAGRGYKFSTYACRAILKAFSRTAQKASRYRSRFPVEFEPDLEKSDWADRKRDMVEEDCVDELKAIVERNLADLSSVEETVIKRRFNWEQEDDAPLTLEEVGKIIGVTKERVRQIQNKALAKIRQVLEDGVLRSTPRKADD